MLPHFIVLGAQKSASTFVQTCLAEHPEIYMPAAEIPFFESPDYEATPLAEFETLFQGRTEKLLGIKRPNYLGRPEVPQRIQQHIPNAKFIVVLRNPIERAISAYYHNINYGFIPPQTVEKGMEAILEQKYQNTYKRAQEVIDFGLYHTHLSRYYQYFKPDQFLVLLHEQVIRDKVAQIQQIYTFLGVDPTYLPAGIDSRPQAVVYSVPRLRFLSLRNHLRYDYSADHTRLSVKQGAWFNELAAKALTGIDRLLWAPLFPSTKPQLSDRLQHKLYDLYEEEINKLENLLNIDLNHWKPI